MPAKLSRAGVVGWYLVPEPQPSVCLVIVLFTYKPMSRMILVPTPTKARKRRAPSPALEVHEDVRGTVFTLDNGRVTRKETVAAKHAKVNFRPSNVRDPLGEWKPTERPEHVSVPVDNLPSVSLSDIHAIGGSDDELDGHDNEDMYRKAGQQVGVEVQHHAPYVDPMEQWKATTMNLWSDILFTHHAYQSCKSCPSSSTAEVFKSHPLHVIQRWAGDFWKADTLANVGIIYHLGHFGRLCPFLSEPTKLVVMDINGVHQVEVCSCTCRPMSFSEELLRHGWYPATVSKPQTVVTLRCLDFYRSLCVVGNVNVHDFVRSLENFTHCGGRDWVPDRYKAFMRVVRQYSFLQRCRRSGRIHEPGGIGSTKHGQVAVQCWACPREGVNLPQGWDMVDKKYRLEFYHMPLMPGLPFSRYLFMLILAMDANFRLKSCIRKNSKGTVQLGDGWGFFVPSKEYREYLSQGINDEDVSNCVAFAALVMANLKFCKGLHVSGIGGVFCSRHGIPRPNGVGDLQKGERQGLPWIFLTTADVFVDIVTWTSYFGLRSYPLTCFSSYSATMWGANIKRRFIRENNICHPTLPPVVHSRFSSAYLSGMVECTMPTAKLSTSSLMLSELERQTERNLSVSGPS
ncbi:hypothetical protein DL96DRAFT_1827827 [Flagelloscypha sp. PMI_526]|nr:hypothetical protein DL96DRAFT_1827827 [Flagelloscypha sp. PMI_526]